MRASRYFWAILLFTVGCSCIAQDLNLYHWKNRIILLKESNLDTDRLKAQIKLLESDSNALHERDLLVFILSDGVVYDIAFNETDLNAPIISKQYQLTDFEGLVLIGKDGGVKMKEGFIVAPKTIFNRVDGMPMRQREMRDQ